MKVKDFKWILMILFTAYLAYLSSASGNKASMYLYGGLIHLYIFGWYISMDLRKD